MTPEQAGLLINELSGIHTSLICLLVVLFGMILVIASK